MADNSILPIPPGATNGDTIRDIDRGAGVKTQVVQLDIGGAASESLVTGAMPVTGTFWQATQPVSIAASVTVQQATAANLNAQVQGPAASGAAKSGNPVQVGGVFNTTQPTVTTGQVVEAQMTARGARIVATGVDALTVQPGNTANTTPWLVTVNQGGNSAVVKAASAAAAFTDAALTVDARPGGALVTASAALADALANPTLGRQAVLNSVFNGTTWDRQRGMGGNATTGDTGAKTATGNGATQTNVGNKGVQIVLQLGVVTGTTPTLVLKVQGSADGGTTWFDIPGATTATLTATGNFGIMIYPGIAVTAGTTTTGTTATANMVLPRSWRVVWTIGGTTPSFTFTAVQFNYLVN